MTTCYEILGNASADQVGGKYSVYHLLVVLVLGMFLGIVCREKVPVLLAWKPLEKVWTPLHVLFMRLLHKWFLYGAAWSFYRSRADAVILKTIRESKDYLRFHFAEGGDGQIWLFKNDLRAFWHTPTFNALYKDLVEGNTNVTRVRLLLTKDQKENTSDARWRKIHENFHGQMRLQDIVELSTLDENELQGPFADFVSTDEAFVFYTREAGLLNEETICIHRLYERAGEDTSTEEHLRDLRITVVASRGGRYSGMDPLYSRFISDPRHVEAFEHLFREDRCWEKLFIMAKERGNVSVADG